MGLAVAAIEFEVPTDVAAEARSALRRGGPGDERGAPCPESVSVTGSSPFRALLAALAADVGDRHGGTVEVFATGPWAPPAGARGVVLFVVSEALGNAFRHGRATGALVAVDGANRTVTVTDNGCGFNPMMRAPGRGLVDMRTLAATVSASICVRSVRHEGTTVELSFA